jgi:outer membrane protein
MNRPRFFLLLYVLNASIAMSGQVVFTRLEDLYSYADSKSNAGKIANEQTLLARWTKVAAVANSINFRNPLSFSMTDNTMLPVNFIPADVFGGPPGTYRQITLGQQYVTNFNFNPQIDIINPANLAKIKSASINKELTEVNNQLVKKALYESISAAWYNIVSINEQLQIMEKSLNASDSLTLIIRNRVDAGISRTQDLNSSTINNISLKDKQQQLAASLKQQINAVRILCDIPLSEEVVISPSGSDPVMNNSVKSASSLQNRHQLLQSELANSELRTSRLNMLPVVSLVYFQGWQKNSNEGFSDASEPWIQSRYLGLRITMPFPPEVNKMSQSYTNRIYRKISLHNLAHTQLQNEANDRSLDVEYSKFSGTYDAAKKIEDLRLENYLKSLEQYKAGILPADLLLNSFNDWLNSRLNTASARSSLLHSENRIKLNNMFK